MCGCVHVHFVCAFSSWHLNHLTSFNEEHSVYQLICGFFFSKNTLNFLWGITKFPDYLLVPILTKVLAHNFLLLFIYLHCTTNQRSSPFRYLVHLLVQGYILCFPEKLKLAVQDTRGQEIPQLLIYRSSWKPFLNLSLILACFFDEAFLFLKYKTSGIGINLLKWWIIRISELSYQVKGILLL